LEKNICYIQIIVFKLYIPRKNIKRPIARSTKGIENMDAQCG
jgi:hypothetical protein